MSASTEDLKNIENKEIKQKAVDKRRLYDKLATGVVTAGGVAIIICIIAILFFIGIETVPLWQSADTELANNFTVQKASSDTGAPGKILLIGTEEYTEIAFTLNEKGVASFIQLTDGSIINETPLVDIEQQGEVTSTFTSDNNKDYVIGTSLGWVIPFSLKYNVTFDKDNNRLILPQIIKSDPIKVGDESLSMFGFQRGEFGGSSVTAYVTDSNKFIFHSVAESEDEFAGQAEVITNSIEITGDIKPADINTIEIDSFLNNLYVGTKDGKIYNWDIRNKYKPDLQEKMTATSSPDIGVTSLGLLLGNRSLFVGDSQGNISVWFPIRNDQGKLVLTRVHEMPKLEGAVSGFANSPRDRGFVASDVKGNVGVYHTTTRTQQAHFKGDGNKLNSITFAPRSNGVVSVDVNGNVNHWVIDNPHPETTFSTLFGKVWYEGYSDPEYVWQSTGGTDEFEPKFSLTPLIYGTLKGAFYALLFAIPLAILSAICVSQFMHPNHRNRVKPIIEIMAALPSVVLGFFAGLWLAPKFEKIFPAAVAMIVIIPLLTIISVFIWQRVPAHIKGRIKVGAELYFLIPVIIAGILICLGLNSTVENLLFAGDYKVWFYEVLGLQYDQRNALIVGFAMGFAVIPIIFTISEDALSSVPKNLTSGSLALGASRWQTAINIVLPSASPGIFSAVMIGLGRAVGETMIVLMATGNTPVMDWSFFNGFRALSANIAVELPEAPHGGTLYRILFLAALLLFFFTFLLNTLAEIIRQRLRKKYGQL